MSTGWHNNVYALSTQLNTGFQSYTVVLPLLLLFLNWKRETLMQSAPGKMDIEQLFFMEMRRKARCVVCSQHISVQREHILHCHYEKLRVDIHNNAEGQWNKKKKRQQWVVDKSKEMFTSSQEISVTVMKKNNNNIVIIVCRGLCPPPPPPTTPRSSCPRTCSHCLIWSSLNKVWAPQQVVTTSLYSWNWHSSLQSFN